MQNVDAKELAKFSELAHGWWDSAGEMRLLHMINPARLAWITKRAPLRGKKVLDIGCGGGILAEAMAKEQAVVKGVDLAEPALAVARLHTLESGVLVDYEKISVENLAAREPEQYDVITCMEMLEHVPYPELIVQACFELLKPNGMVFFSTINRSLKAYLLAIVGAEYCLKLLARGTHEYDKFIRPAELASYARKSGFMVREVAGMDYNPLTERFKFSAKPGVNYFMLCEKKQN